MFQEAFKGNVSLAFLIIVFLATTGCVAAQGEWYQIAPMSTGIIGSGAATGRDGHIYLIGGYDSSENVLDTVEAYSPATNTWSDAPPMPTARLGIAAVTADNGRIYVFGGSPPDSPVVGTVEALDTTTSPPSWATVSPMPTARTNMGATLGHNGKIYVMGGIINSGEVLNTVEIYDPTSDHWTEGAPLPTARQGMVVATGSNGLIYAMGGADEQGNVLSVVEVYDPITNNWLPANTAQPMLQGVLIPAGVSGSDGLIYVAGGINANSGTILNTVQAYNPVTNTWNYVASMSTPRFSLPGALGHNGRIYVFGGQDGDIPGGILDTAEAYTTTAILPVITSFSPATGVVGQSVTINGQYLEGATSVQFNGVSAAITSDVANKVVATVPAGTSTGPISVTTPAGTATSATDFTLDNPLVVTSVSETAVTPSSVTVSWSTNDPATAVIDYGTTTGYGSSMPVGGYSKTHTATITGLGTLTLYHFQIVAQDKGGNTSASADQTVTTGYFFPGGTSFELLGIRYQPETDPGVYLLDYAIVGTTVPIDAYVDQAVLGAQSQPKIIKVFVAADSTTTAHMRFTVASSGAHGNLVTFYTTGQVEDVFGNPISDWDNTYQPVPLP